MVIAQGAKVTAERSFPAIEQAVSQILNGQETSLLKCFHRDPLHPMSTQSFNALLPSDLEILFARVQSQGDGDLFAMRQRSSWSFLARDHLEDHLPRFNRSAGLEVRRVVFINRIQNGLGLERGTLHPLNDFVYKLLVQLFLGQTVPFLKR